MKLPYLGFGLILLSSTALAQIPYITKGTSDSLSAVVGGSEKLNIATDGTVSATAFVGDGSGLTNVVGSSIWTNAAGDATYSGGDVGIHVANPTANLHIQNQYDVTANPDNSGIRMTRVSGGQSWLLSNGVSGVANDYWALRDITAGAYRLIVDTSGNVGIGTTPSSKLHIADSQAGDASPANFTLNNSDTSGRTWLHVTSDTTSGGLVVNGSTMSDSTVHTVPNKVFLWAAGNSSGMDLHVDAPEPLRMFTSATERMRIAPNGHIGVNTVSPTESLTIENDAQFNGISLKKSNGNYVGYLVGGDTDGDNGQLVLADSGAVKTVFNAVGNSYVTGGNFGVGVPIPVHSLDVQRTTADSQFIANFDGTDVNNYGVQVNIANTTSNRDILRLRSAGADKFVVTGDGRVGIGTSSPLFKLDVLGEARAQQDFSVPDDRSFKFGDGSTRLEGSGSSDYIAFLTDGGIERARVATGGNVGIGTSTPNAKLDVVGTVSATAFVGDGSGLTNVTGSGLWTDSSGNVTFTSGNVGMGTNSPLYVTDIRNATNSTQVHISGTGNDDGGYLLAYDTSGMFVSGGATYDGTNWTAKSVSSSIFTQLGGSYGWYADTGLTVGNTYTPTQIAALNTNGDFTLLGNNGSASHIFRYNEDGGEILLHDELGNSALLIDYIGSTTDSARILQHNTAGDLQIGLSGTNTTGNTIFMKAGYTEAARIDANGNVGIGTTSPGTARLNIVGSTADNSSYSLFTQNSAASPSLVVRNDGNVGIGASAPGTQLHIQGSDSYDARLALDFTAAGGERWDLFPTVNAIHGAADGSLMLWNNTQSLVSTVWDNTGNMGIGTSSPKEKLHVEGAILSYRDNTSGILGSTRLEGKNTSSAEPNKSSWVLYNMKDYSGEDGLSFWQYYDADNDGVYCDDAGQCGSRMIITHEGSVGIGTRTPNGKFEVAESNNAVSVVHQTDALAASKYAQLVLANGNTYFGANDRSYQIANESVSGTTSDFKIQYWDGTTTQYRFKINNDGNVGIGPFNTEVPADNLHVKATSGTGIRVENTTSGSYWRLSSRDNGDFDIGKDGLDSNLKIKSSGDIGIGTSTPSAKLDVVGTVEATAFVGDGSGLTNISGGGLWTDSSGNATFTTGGVGIGTTSPATKLEVNNGDVLIRKTGYPGMFVMNPDKTDGTLGKTWAWMNYSGGMLLNGYGSTDAGSYAPGAPVMAMFAEDTTGNIGLGTVTPQSKLDVRGEIRAYATSGDATLRLGIGTTEKAKIAADTNGDLYFEADRAEAMRIETGGNVGINTTNPWGPLDVKTGTDRRVVVFDQPAGTTLTGTNDSGASTGLRIAGYPLMFTGNGGAGAEHARFHQSGSMSIGTTTETVKLAVAGGVDVGVVDTSNLFRLNYDTTNGGNMQSYIGGGYAKTSINPHGGSVAIGTSTTTAGYKLSVNGAIHSMSSNVTVPGFAVAEGDGMYNIGSDGIGFAVGAAEQMRIASTGRVGVNTTTPDGQLQINGGTAMGGSWNRTMLLEAEHPTITLRSTSTSSGRGYIGYDGAASTEGLVLKAGGDDDEINNAAYGIKIAASGNVGIAATTPTAKLHVETADTGASTIVRVTADDGGDAVTLGKNASDDGTISITDGDGTVRTHLVANDPSYINSNAVSENVLQVGGYAWNGSGYLNSNFGQLDIKQLNSAQSYPAVLSFSSSYANGGATPFANIVAQPNAAGSKLYFNTSNNYTSGPQVLGMMIDESGKVGIGIPYPRAALDVSGGILLNPAADDQGTSINILTKLDGSYSIGGGTTKGWHQTFRGDQYSNTNEQNDWAVWAYDGGSGSIRFAIDHSTGNTGIGVSVPSYKLHVEGTAYATGAAGSLSDRRHKDDITPLAMDGLETVAKLNPVSFTWKDVKDKGMEGTQFGFIAQEVEEVIPEMVMTQDDEDQTKAMKNDMLLPVLVKAIQELKAENEQLRARLDAVEAK